MRKTAKQIKANEVSIKRLVACHWKRAYSSLEAFTEWKKNAPAHFEADNLNLYDCKFCGNYHATSKNVGA